MATLEKNKKGYCVSYFYYDSSGKRRHKRESFAKYNQAIEFKRKIENEIANMEYIEDTKLTLGMYLNDWIESYKKNISPNTYRGYKKNIEHINLHLGNIQLQKVSAINIQKTYDNLQETLSGTTVLYIHRVLNIAFKQAVKFQVIKKNPCEFVDTPKKKKYKAAFYNNDEFTKLLELSVDEDIYIAILLGASRGMRRNEILGLEWSKIDFKNNVIHIDKSIRWERKEYYLETPKSETSIRDIPLSPKLVKALQDQKKKQLHYKQMFWQDYFKSDFVCTYKDGSLINPGTFSHIYADFLKKNNLRHIRFHDLRHTAASLMLKEKIDMKVVSEILGHSTITITADLYSHVLDELKQEAALKMDKLL